MAVGMSFMVGPVVGAKLLATHDDSMMAAIILTILSGMCLIFLPTPIAETTRRIASSANLQNLERDSLNQSKNGSSRNKADVSLASFLSLPVVNTTGARLLFLLRCGMGLAFHIFMTSKWCPNYNYCINRSMLSLSRATLVWPTSLKTRFEFGPTDHAYFMGWIGLCYAISQGFVAQVLIRLAGENSTLVLIVCMIALSLGRVIAITTYSLYMMYIVMAFVIIALGVVNTTISSACSRLAGADQVGGLFGIMEGVENISGLIGPALGGLLYRLNDNVPLLAVVGIYLLLLVFVFVFYTSSIVKYVSPHAKTD